MPTAATPVVYNVPAGRIGRGGLAPANDWPAWRKAVTKAHWAQVPMTNTLADLNPQFNDAINPSYPNAPEWFGSFGAIIGAWCGMAYDVETDTWYDPIPGGHADYAGGESYKLGSMRADNPTCSMLGLPVGAKGVGVKTDDRARFQPGSTLSELVLAGGDNAPIIFGGRDEASAVDGAYVGMKIPDGTADGKTITAYNGTTRTATITPPYTSSKIGSTYYIVDSAGAVVHGILGELTGLYANGDPRATHTYNKCVMVPGIGPMITVQGNVSWSGNFGTTRPIVISPTTGKLIKMGAPYTKMQASKGATCWDDTRKCAWFRHAATGKIARYFFFEDRWEEVGNIKAMSGDIALEYMPQHDCLFVASTSLARDFAIFDCKTFALTEPASVGSIAGGAIMGRFQPRWVPALGAIACWDNASDTTAISVITPAGDPRSSTWTFSMLSVAPTNNVTPTTRAGNGTFGRFAYSPYLKGFFVLNNVAQRPFFYALDN